MSQEKKQNSTKLQDLKFEKVLNAVKPLTTGKLQQLKEKFRCFYDELLEQLTEGGYDGIVAIATGEYYVGAPPDIARDFAAKLLKEYRQQPTST